MLPLPARDGRWLGQSVVRLIIAYLWSWVRLFFNNGVGMYWLNPLTLEERGISCKRKLIFHVSFYCKFLEFGNEGAWDVLGWGYLFGDGFRDDANEFLDSIPTMEDILDLVAVLDVPERTRLPFHAAFLFLFIITRSTKDGELDDCLEEVRQRIKKECRCPALYLFWSLNEVSIFSCTRHFLRKTGRKNMKGSQKEARSWSNNAKWKALVLVYPSQNMFSASFKNISIL